MPAHAHICIRSTYISFCLHLTFNVCLFQSLTQMNPRFEPMKDGATANKQHWAQHTEST